MEKDTNPKDAIGTKKWRQFFVVPRQVLWEVGVGMLEGALKYGRHNYRGAGVRASVYCDAAVGHIEQFIEGEDIDKDSGLSHVTKAICSLVVLRDAMMNDFWTDDRPPKIKNLDALRDRLQKLVEENFDRHEDKQPHHYSNEEDGAPYRGGSGSTLAQVNLEPIEQRVLARMIESGEWSDRVAEQNSRDKLAAARDRVRSNGWLGSMQDVPEEVEAWNADEVAVQDERILAIASSPPASVIGRVTIGPKAEVDALLADLTYLPMDPLEILGSTDPSRWFKIAREHVDYDREHVVEGLTQCQIDRLVAHEGRHMSIIESYAASDPDMWNALCRRVMLRLRTRLPLWHRVDFADGGTDRRFSRLRSDEWFIAIPGCRVTPDPTPKAFA